MDKKIKHWELLILDASPPTREFACLTVGDLDGDGKVEIVAGGDGALLWYRPDTFERGIIAKGDFTECGLALEDLDGDGIMEAVVSERKPNTSTWMITWYKPRRDLNQLWTRHILDHSCIASGTHDLLFVDLDDDGEKELVVNDYPMKGQTSGLYAYKRSEDVTKPWRKYTIQAGIFEEGLAAADLDGDGKIEIVHGPDWYSPPPEGTFSGPWKRGIFAPSFRDMVRVALSDITGNGREDVIIVESEYPDGIMSWFENRLVENPENPWVEHKMDRGLNFAHSLGAWRDPNSGKVRVFLAEMAKGGWKAPYNFDARLIEYSSSNQGKTWQREILYQGNGTHQAIVYDVDNDGIPEIIGKEWNHAKMHIWKRQREASIPRFRHRLLDRDKPYTATDILAMDVDGDGLLDVVCGAWWYKNPGWQRYGIPGICQVVNAYDIDGDGHKELIAIKGSVTSPDKWYEGLSSELCWLKPMDPVNGKWEEHPIGSGTGDWPHGSAIAYILPGGKPALIVTYHGAYKYPYYPEIFEIPNDPKDYPWPKRILAEISYGEELAPCDIDGDGKIDIVAGEIWFENLGDGNFSPHRIAEGFDVARVSTADLNNNGRPDIIIGEGVFQSPIPFSRIAWFENPGDSQSGLWKPHIIDTVRCPHSLAVADVDNDGEMEIICGEHDPSIPYRSRCRLMVYKRAEPRGRSWFRYVLDDRFEHHCGTKVFEVAPGRMGIISHGWKDSRYVHLWEAC